MKGYKYPLVNSTFTASPRYERITYESKSVSPETSGPPVFVFGKVMAAKPYTVYLQHEKLAILERFAYGSQTQAEFLSAASCLSQEAKSAHNDFFNHWSSEVVPATRNEFLLRLNGRKHNLYEILASYRQTMNTLLNRLGKTAKIIDAIQRRDVKRFRRAVGQTRKGDSRRKIHALENQLRSGKTFANIWLEFRYVLEPLYIDVYNAVVMFHKGAIPGVVFAIRKKASVKFSYEDYNSVSSYDVGGADYRFHLLYEEFRRIHIVGHFKIDLFAGRLLSSYGITDPVATAWELLPGSFVIDWFVNVSDYLLGLEAMHGVEFLTGSETTTVRTTVAGRAYTDRSAYPWYPWTSQFKDSPPYSFPGQYFVQPPKSYTYRMEREVLKKPPAPSLFFVTDPLKRKRILDLLSFITIAASGRRDAKTAKDLGL